MLVAQSQPMVRTTIASATISKMLHEQVGTIRSSSREEAQGSDRTSERSGKRGAGPSRRGADSGHKERQKTLIRHRNLRY